MLALKDDRQRLFVWWMANGAPTATAAARAAGYGDKSQAAKVRGSELMQRPAILEALHEAGAKAMKGLAPLAINKARAILQDPTHPGHARMIETVLDRTGFFAESRHTMTVEHTVDTKELESLARRLALENGIDPKRLLGTNTPVIEGEVVVERTADE